MDFGQALEAMKRGKRVARAGWNGKGMWIALTLGSVITQGQARAGAAIHLADEKAFQDAAAGRSEPESKITICAHIDMRAADGSLVVGWLASQTDMLAEDWSEVTEVTDAPSRR